MIGLSIVGVCTKKPCNSKAFFCPFTFFISALPLQSKPKEAVTHLLLLTSYLLPKMEPKYKVNPLTGELQEYVFEYNGMLALRNFTARVEDERLILHAADDVNFSILEALVSEVEINGVVYDNPTAAQEALTRLTFNQNRPVLLDKTLKDLILGAVQKIPGKKLSTEDFTTELRQKLESLQQVDTSGLLPKGGYTGTAQDLKNLIDAINRILQSDDTDLDQLQEIVTYIKQNKHILNTLGINNIAGLVEALAAKADKDHHHDERYAPITHHHNEYAHRTHRHNKDDIDGLPANIATTENVKTAIDGIQIGGRNYILNSKNELYNEYRGTSESYIIYQIAGDTLEKNTTYILSLEYKSQDLRSVDLFFINENVSQTPTKNIPNTNGEWKKETFMFTTDSNLSPKGYIRIDNNGSATGNVTSKLWTRLVKLERGNNPTDWTPAPEDLALSSDIQRTAISINSNYVVPPSQQNNTILIENGLNIDLSRIENRGVVSFLKLTNATDVTFSCPGKTIRWFGDTNFSGKEGSTAVVTIYNDQCIIKVATYN
jgi:hypothetical protein